ncbi:haloacid dehalogenase type II [Aquibacillus kalidii]|uniref:haloacid dehalogenase type II n=1 Tax=Aquibacillus kalidii TaxID=2762597 RepID=UPI0016492B8C|nr:haloacid dehalogenase type II [Aquibacillus kalidii]
MTAVKAFVFDVYGTLFDVHSIKEKCNLYFPGKGDAISSTWREKQIEYSFLKELMNDYDTFYNVTRDSLKYAVEEQNEIITKQQQDDLLRSYLTLSLFPEVENVITQVQDMTLAVFSNGSHDMLDPLINNSRIKDKFDHIISVDEVKHYKPTTSAYQHCLDILQVDKKEVLFMSSNGWDISGAKHFGFQTAWINRNRLPVEGLNLLPNVIYKDLNGILEWQD